VIHVYGVVDELAELPAARGLDDAPLERRRIEGLEVVLSRAETPPSSGVSRETVLRHAQVVEELMARSGALLPAQLGRAFHDEAELAAALREQAMQLTRALERVRGCVEFGLRAVAEDRGEAAAESGAEYMRVRLEQVRRQDALVAALHEPLARLARESTLHRDATGEVRAAYLLPRAEIPAFREAVARVAASPKLTVVCTGPWPPYSFATAEGER
jgi:hypothetical protein